MPSWPVHTHQRNNSRGDSSTWSGNNAKETVGVLAESAETLLDHHEELPETTRNIAIVAAVLGLLCKQGVPMVGIAFTAVGDI